MNRRRGRASGTVFKQASGVGLDLPRAGARGRTKHPHHERSSEAQSAKTGSDPTAAHGLSAVRLLQAAVFQCSQSATMRRLRPLSTPTYPQRTRVSVTPVAPRRATTQQPRLSRVSLSLGSLGLLAALPKPRSTWNRNPVRLWTAVFACLIASVFTIPVGLLPTKYLLSVAEPQSTSWEI